MASFESSDDLRLILCVDQSPPALFNATQWGLRSGRVQPIEEKPFPVVLSHLVHSCDDILELVWLGRRSVFGSEKYPAEVVKRTLSAGLLADDGIGFQPYQPTLGIEIVSAAFRRPCSWRE